MDAYDAVLDARSEARYALDPSAEPDTREVADTVAGMILGDAESAAAGLIYRG